MKFCPYFDTKTTFAMDVVVQSLGAVVTLIATGLRSFSDLFLTQPSRATLKHLEETDLKPLTGARKPLKAKCLWEKSGAVIMAVRRPG
uniref:Uncharacterized protein n=2 Tax=Oncorhynchus TaxID=8016 RepID=A0A8C7GFE4_ONCKI